MILALLTACDDPALEPYEASLAAYEAGQAALAAGDPAAAATRFAEARGHDPKSVPLRLWEAKALADAGRLDEADARLTELLASDPTVGIAWYNRAAWRARAGRMEDAASDLRRAFELRVRSPLEAADDPDFAAARAHPAFAGVLPPQPLEATLRGPDGAVFVGSRFPLELATVALASAELTLTRAGPDPGCLALARVVQDDRADGAVVLRRLTVDHRAVGPCEAPLGPFTVAAGAATVELPAVPVKVEAPPGAPPATGLPPLPAAIPFPSAVAPPDAGFAAERVGDGVAAMGRPDRAITAEGRAPDVALEWRVDGQTRAVGGWWRSPGPLALGAEGWSTRVE